MGRSENYKWIALSNTTLASFLVAIDSSIMLIALPDIFRGIRLDPLRPGNSFYLLWMILGFLIVTSVLVVGFGRLGDLYGRVRMYNLGFVVFAVATLLLAVDPLHGRAGADWLIAFRIAQGVGGAFLLGNGTAILTDAFPATQRGLALGINGIVLMAGQFIGLVVGGVLAPIDWRMIFIVPLPFAIFGAAWSYVMLKESGLQRRAPIDWVGNLTFAAGLVFVMVGVTHGIQPYGGSQMGWTSPLVDACLATGAVLLTAFVVVELRVAHPMFQLSLFRTRAYASGVLAGSLSALARGGLMFMLVIWLQGIWLPAHGYSFSRTPLIAGICMLPLTAGFLLVGPLSGWLSDRFGSRHFATAGMIGSAAGFALLALLPTQFSYLAFAAIILGIGASMGLFASPNRASVMNSLPAQHRGAGGGMNQTFQNSAQVLSIGVFFTLMIVGLSATLPSALGDGLRAHGVASADAERIAGAPPVSVIFAAFLGENPIRALAGPQVLSQLSPTDADVLTGREYFPSLIAAPFRTGLHQAFAFAVICCLVAAAASWRRGDRWRERGQLRVEPADDPVM